MQNERRKVAFLLPTLAGGGAERVAVNVLKMFPDAERHLVLLERLIAYDFDAELHVLKGDPARDSSIADRVGLLGKNLVALAALKRKLGAATWLSFTTWANVLNVLAPGPRSSKVVLSSHNRESVNIRGRAAAVLKGAVRLTYPRAARIVAVSEAVRQDLIDSFGVPPGTIETLYNTVDLAEAEAQATAQLDTELTALLKSPTIVTAGNLGDQKGQWHLVRAFALVKRQVPNARLLLLGQGRLGEYLVGLSRDAGLVVWAAWEDTPRDQLPQADVVFTGFTPNPFACFARASVFAFPSLWEGFGNVIIEALATGALVLAADCRSGPREILGPENPSERSLAEPELASAGILMPVLDGEKRAAMDPATAVEQKWVDMLVRALVDRSLAERYREPARIRAREFSTVAMTARWRAVLL
jgi:glycosyltransferase involved in cell wall biosynthesis